MRAAGIGMSVQTGATKAKATAMQTTYGAVTTGNKNIENGQEEMRMWIETQVGCYPNEKPCGFGGIVKLSAFSTITLNIKPLGEADEIRGKLIDGGGTVLLAKYMNDHDAYTAVRKLQTAIGKGKKFFSFDEIDEDFV